MKGASQIAPFGLRMPEELKERIAERARQNGRSMNAEIVQILEDVMTYVEDDPQSEEVLPPMTRKELSAMFDMAFEKIQQQFELIPKDRNDKNPT